MILLEDTKLSRLKIIKAGRRNKDEEALVLVKKLLPKTQQISELSTQLIDAVNSNLHKSVTHSREQAKRNAVIIGVIISVGALIGSLVAFFSSRLLLVPLLAAQRQMQAVANGDFRVGGAQTEFSEDELGSMQTAIQTSIVSVSEIIDKINEKSSKLSEQSALVSKSSGTITNMCATISNSVDQIEIGTEDLLGQVNSVTEKLEFTEERILSHQSISKNICSSIQRESERFAQKLIKLKQILSHMDMLRSSVQKITSISATIDDISKQTSLLALNASIEASGAGDAGRGFAIVANEVRTLASRSAAAVKEIFSIANSVTEEVESAFKLLGSLSV